MASRTKANADFYFEFIDTSIGKKQTKKNRTGRIVTRDTDNWMK